jgi:hypothetical protein
MSRGFLIVLAGVVITLLGYFGVAQWAAQPAYVAARIIYGADNEAFDDLDPFESLLLVVFLLHVNVAVWAFITWLAVKVVRPSEDEGEEKAGGKS